MPHSPSFDRDVGAFQHLLDDAFKGMRAAETVLFHHSRPDARLTAINFPQEEALLREAIDLLTGCKRHAAALLGELDRMTSSASLQFERLFDENAGRQSEGFWRRRVRPGMVAPDAIVTELAGLLAVSAALDRMIRDSRPVVVDHHRNCEACLLLLVERRQRVDRDLEAADGRLALLKIQTKELRTASYARSPSSNAATEEKRRILALERQAAQATDDALQSERETLQRMIADDADFVDALNAGIAAVNAMAAKLAVDIEQRVALLKAVAAQSPVATMDFPASVQALIAAFDADILAGHDLLERKQRTDEAFFRRMDASLPSLEMPAEAVSAPETPTLPPI